MITLAQAKALQPDDILYSMRNFNRQGEPQRWRVTSIKTWKTRPDEIRIGLKHGLYAYATLTQSDLHLVTLDEETARDARAA